VSPAETFVDVRHLRKTIIPGSLYEGTRKRLPRSRQQAPMLRLLPANLDTHRSGR